MPHGIAAVTYNRRTIPGPEAGRRAAHAQQRVGGSAPDGRAGRDRASQLLERAPPPQRSFTVDPGGASTVRRRIRTPRPDTRPAIRTTGNGLRKDRPRWPTFVPGEPGLPTFRARVASSVAFVVARSPIV
jgi:hypothetical protein